MAQWNTLKSLKSKIIIPATKEHTGSLIFLHGSGGTKEEMRHCLREVYGKDFSFPHLRVIFPQAPARPYTPLDGALSNAWFDRTFISHDAPEDLPSTDYMCTLVKGLVNEEVKAGINKERIILGGFSMGGSLSLHMGFRYTTDIAGIFTLSSFLPPTSAVFESIKENPHLQTPPVFMCHGTDDDIVGYSWGKQTAQTLQALNKSCHFETYAYLSHSFCNEELQSLRDWILETVKDA